MEQTRPTDTGAAGLYSEPPGEDTPRICKDLPNTLRPHSDRDLAQKCSESIKSRNPQLLAECLLVDSQLTQANQAMALLDETLQQKRKLIGLLTKQCNALVAKKKDWSRKIKQCYETK